MTQLQKAKLYEKLTALTEGPTPLYHHVSLKGDMVAITVQPWGHPMYLNWSQAETFANALPLEVTPRKNMGRATGQHRKLKHA